MRAPRRHRPARRVIIPPPDGCDPEAAASRACYVGSPEHKDAPSFAGWPRPRADATICDPAFATRQADINDWLRTAIRDGHTGAWAGDFPRYVWHRVGESVYEARLVNEGNGEYKAYELSRDEWPEGL
jgi:hypothetical protein